MNINAHQRGCKISVIVNDVSFRTCFDNFAVSYFFGLGLELGKRVQLGLSKLKGFMCSNSLQAILCLYDKSKK